MSAYTELWNDWRKASDERDEARKFAVYFRYAFEAAQICNKAYKALTALDRDEIEALTRRITELENSIKDEAWEETDERWGE